MGGGTAATPRELAQGSSYQCRGCPGTVYPRVGGGTGSSGCGLVPFMPRSITRSIPAWAGEPIGRIPACTKTARRTRVYPRVGGGTPQAPVPAGTVVSPRGRGNRPGLVILYILLGLSPRGRGNRGRSLHKALSPVYPRVGGGTPNAVLVSYSERGLSPRGRGNHFRRFRRSPYRRSIPAWAGEPRC